MDENDPHAGKITYPSAYLGEQIIRNFSLKTNSERRCWFSPDSKKVSETITWSSGISVGNNERDPNKQGQLVNVSTDFLKTSRQYKRNILIEVIIHGREYYNNSSVDSEKGRITKYLIFSPEKGLE